MQLEATPLLQTKLEMPPLRAHTLARERLLAQLKTSETRLLLLCAPAGFGKTTLLASYAHTLAEQREAAVAWLALDESDNDPARFLAYLAAAVAQAIAPRHPNAAAIQQINVAGTNTEAVLAQLVNATTALDCNAVLVLDDYHLISTPAVHAAVAFLLDHLPKQVQVAIGSRSDPPLPLARLRARGQLLELRAADLRFTLGELQAFFAASQLALTPDDLRAVGAYVEGWPAGVQLVALALCSAPCEQVAQAECVTAASPTGALVHRLNDSQQHIFAYLADDVFERQPAHRKAFLLQTAILDRMCGPLCDAVLGVGDASCSPRDAAYTPDSYSRLVLEEIEHANLFVTPVDGAGCWYRYHQLFRAFLHARLDREPAIAVAELHRRASAWYEQNQLLADAVEHALAAGEHARAAELVEASATKMIERGEYARLHGWLDRIPEALLAARPALCLWAAWAALLAGEVARIETPLQRAKQAWRDESERHKLGAVAHLEAHLARLRGDAARTIDAAHRALADLADDEVTLRAGSLLALGAGQLLAGDLDAAGTTLADAFTQCQAHNFLGTLVALGCLGDLAARRGQLRAAAQHYQEAIALAGARSVWERWSAIIRLADLQRERDDLERALELLSPALAAAERAGVAAYLIPGYISLARIHQARGDGAAAALALDQASHRAHQLESPVYTRHIHAEQARLALAQGNLQAAQHWQLELAPKALVDDETLIEIRVLIAQARHAPGGHALRTAYMALVRLREDAAARGCTRSLIELLMLTALAEASGGRREQALTALQRSLLLAQPEGYARIFLDEGAPIQSLLAAYRSEISHTPSGMEQAKWQELLAYVDRLLAGFNDCRVRVADSRLPAEPSAVCSRQSALAEPLSERELEVLELIASGASNQNIAAALVISIGTVKSHINHILGKLAAVNRTEAVSRARALGLLST